MHALVLIRFFNQFKKAQIRAVYDLRPIIPTMQFFLFKTGLDYRLVLKKFGRLAYRFITLARIGSLASSRYLAVRSWSAKNKVGILIGVSIKIYPVDAYFCRPLPIFLYVSTARFINCGRLTKRLIIGEGISFS